MKRKYILIIVFILLCGLFPARVFALADSDLIIRAASAEDKLENSSGILAVDQFPARITVNVTVQTGSLTGVWLEHNGQSREITPDYAIVINDKESCGPYTITGRTDRGAVLTITANVVFEVKAVYDIRYRTVAMNVKEIDQNEKAIENFDEPQRIELENANTVAPSEQEKIADWIGKNDGGTYTLKGSLVVEIHSLATGKIYGIYDTDKDFEKLVRSFPWTNPTKAAFATMRKAEITYQAPVKINVDGTWCDESKQEIYGSLSAQDKGVPVLLKPCQTTDISFAKEDIPLPSEYIYTGLEWDYTPEGGGYADGQSPDQTSISQDINYQIPAAKYYFKFDKQDIHNLSVVINAPETVYRGDKYTFTVTYKNSGTQAANGVSLKGKTDGKQIEEIPASWDFQAGESKTYIIERLADTSNDVINLWANIGIPDGYNDANPADNTATAEIKVQDKPEDKPPGSTESCDLKVEIKAPAEVYEQEEYSFTVIYTNCTDTVLTGASLEAAIDGRGVDSIPSQADFKAKESKSFQVKTKAGEKGTTIHLTAKVSPPVDCTDTNPDNNRAAADIKVGERYDLDVQRITPAAYKENQSVISTIKVGNTGSTDFTPGEKVSVLFNIPELSLQKRVDAVVMAQDTWNVVAVKWNTPSVQADKNITLIATINPDKTLTSETTAANNTYTQKAVIKNVIYDEPEENIAVPVPPPRSDQPRVTWQEQRYENGKFVWRQFYAELKVNAYLYYDTKDKGYLKSGYGFFINVTASVNTNYDKPELITDAQTAEVYLPQYLYETAIPLLSDSKNHFTFQENPSSPFRYKKQYVPVWFPDNTEYIVQLLVTDVHTPGGTLSKWITGGDLQIFVSDSMYSDDVTTAE